jgi:hypothetical protein
MTKPTSHYGIFALALLLAWWLLRKTKTAPVAASPVPAPVDVEGPPSDIPPAAEPIEVEQPAIVTYTPEPTTTPDPVVTTTDGPQGVGTGFQSGYGWGYGDFTDAAILALSPQSQWHLWSTPFANSNLWMSWGGVRFNPDGDAMKEDVRNAITAAFAGYNALVESLSNPVPSSFQGW